MKPICSRRNRKRPRTRCCSWSLKTMPSISTPSSASFSRIARPICGGLAEMKYTNTAPALGARARRGAPASARRRRARRSCPRRARTAPASSWRRLSKSRLEVGLVEVPAVDDGRAGAAARRRGRRARSTSTQPARPARGRARFDSGSSSHRLDAGGDLAATTPSRTALAATFTAFAIAGARRAPVRLHEELLEAEQRRAAVLRVVGEVRRPRGARATGDACRAARASRCFTALLATSFTTSAMPSMSLSTTLPSKPLADDHVGAPLGDVVALDVADEVDAGQSSAGARAPRRARRRP